MDSRRERNNIFKQFDNYQRDEGGSLLWFKFDVDNSSYDSTYDEGGKTYHVGRIVSYLWIDKTEDTKTVSPEGTRATERLHAAFSVRTLDETGIGGHEAAGGRRRDYKPSGKPWWDSRLNDLLFYKDRWWEVTGFTIRDQVKEEPVVVGVTAIETQLQDEHVWDLFPADYGYGVPGTPPATQQFDGGGADGASGTIFDGGGA